MAANSLSTIQCGTGIFGKSNFISTNMRKMKTNTTQTANYHPLGPLSPYFSPRDKKMDDSRVCPLEKKKKEKQTKKGKKWEAGPVRSVQGTALLAWTIQVDTLVPPVIFQTYYFTRKVINDASATSLVSSVPCGVNHRQILCH